MKPLKRSCLKPYLKGSCVVRWKITSSEDVYVGLAKEGLGTITANEAADEEILNALSIPFEFYYRITPSIDVSAKNGENIPTWRPVPKSLSYDSVAFTNLRVVDNENGRITLHTDDSTLTIERVSRLIASALHTAFQYHE